MMCQTLVDEYVSWLRDKIKVEETGGACAITIPFLDRHNDHLQVYVVPEGQGFRITDDSYIIGDLQTSGCSIDTPNRKKLLEQITKGLGVQEQDGELFVVATPRNFPQKKHALVQAMLAVNDMFMTSRHRVATLFLEDVALFLDEHEVRYTPNAEFTGQTGFVHKFDFVIPKSKQQPERIIRAINNPSRDAVTAVLFALTDTREVRPPDSRFAVFLNDTEKEISGELLSALQGYDVSVIPWKRRMEFVSYLGA